MKVSELTNHCDDILLSRKTPKRDVQTFSWDGERGAEVMCRNVPEMQVGLRAADEKLCTRAYTVSCLFSSFNVCDAQLCQHHWLSVARAFPPSLTAHFPLLPLVPGTFLVNCRNNVRQIHNKSNGVEGLCYSWSTCSKQPRLVDCRIGVNKLDRPSTAMSCRGEIFQVRIFGQSSRGKYPSF